jgi:hypothetical protein
MQHHPPWRTAGDPTATPGQQGLVMLLTVGSATLVAYESDGEETTSSYAGLTIMLS